MSLFSNTRQEHNSQAARTEGEIWLSLHARNIRIDHKAPAGSRLPARCSRQRCSTNPASNNPSERSRRESSSDSAQSRSGPLIHSPTETPKPLLGCSNSFRGASRKSISRKMCLPTLPDFHAHGNRRLRSVPRHCPGLRGKQGSTGARAVRDCDPARTGSSAVLGAHRQGSDGQPRPPLFWRQGAQSSAYWNFGA